MAYPTCPYLTSGSRCNISNVYKDGYERDTYCMSSNNWTQCPNYKGASQQTRASKMVK